MDASVCASFHFFGGQMITPEVRNFFQSLRLGQKFFYIKKKEINNLICILGGGEFSLKLNLFYLK
jgi:hypothetical protein